MPKQISMDKVQQIIGEDATKRLLEEAAGTIIYVTKDGKASKAARDAEIKEVYYSSFLSYDEIGEQFGLSGERIRQIVNDKRHPA